MKKTAVVMLVLLALALGYGIGRHASLVSEAIAGPRDGGAGLPASNNPKVYIDRNTRVACYYNEAGISCVAIDRVEYGPRAAVLATKKNGGKLCGLPPG